jgi:nicotinamidase-related amidase
MVKALKNLHGNVPDRCSVALLLIDVINDLDFPGNAAILKSLPNLTSSISKLKERCKEKRIPTIYANDNQGRWRSDFKTVLAHCMRPDAPGREMVKALRPEPDDYIFLKPKHSAFHATPLDTLLAYLGTRTVILAGLTTSACVLLTAGEIYVRDLKLFVPADCVAGLRKSDHRKALDLMRTSFRAHTTLSSRLNLAKLRGAARY